MTLAAPSLASAAIAKGSSGRLYVLNSQGRRTYVGLIGAWKVVISPTTKQPTLITEAATIRRYWLRHPPRAALAVLQPDQPHAYIGRPKPPPAKPFAVRGAPSTWRNGQVILSEGSIEQIPQ